MYISPFFYFTILYWFCHTNLQLKYINLYLKKKENYQISIKEIKEDFKKKKEERFFFKDIYSFSLLLTLLTKIKCKDTYSFSDFRF